MSKMSLIGGNKKMSEEGEFIRRIRNLAPPTLEEAMEDFKFIVKIARRDYEKTFYTGKELVFEPNQFQEAWIYLTNKIRERDLWIKKWLGDK